MLVDFWRSTFNTLVRPTYPEHLAFENWTIRFGIRKLSRNNCWFQSTTTKRQICGILSLCKLFPFQHLEYTDDTAGRFNSGCNRRSGPPTTLFSSLDEGVNPWPVDLLQIQVSWRRTRERRGQIRDDHWHLTMERYPTNITPLRRRDGQAVAYRAISKMQGRSLPMEQPSPVNICCRCELALSGDECEVRERTNAHRRDNGKEFQDERPLTRRWKTQLLHINSLQAWVSWR